ncbi:MAG: hypothetical protein DRN96_07965 [Thermoproteota archaeon]|nr:MAG: hypothetical protein DRN96_07965 [Candidatus Korarchaeota archaeon]
MRAIQLAEEPNPIEVKTVSEAIARLASERVTEALVGDERHVELAQLLAAAASHKPLNSCLKQPPRLPADSTVREAAHHMLSLRSRLALIDGRILTLRGLVRACLECKLKVAAEALAPTYMLPENPTLSQIAEAAAESRGAATPLGYSSEIELAEAALALLEGRSLHIKTIAARVDLGSPASQAAYTMISEKTPSIPVYTGSKLTGIITEEKLIALCLKL